MVRCSLEGVIVYDQARVRQRRSHGPLLAVSLRSFGVEHLLCEYVLIRKKR